MKKKTNKKFRKKQNMQTWFFLMTILIAQLLFYTWCRVQCIRIGYEIAAEEIKNHNLISLQNSLNIEFERLKSPERLAGIAETHYKLATPTRKQVIVIP